MYKSNFILNCLEGNITTNAIFTVQVVVIFFTGIIFCGRIFFGYFKRLLPFMPPPQPRTANSNNNNGGLTCFDENNFDSDGDEYQYEWVRQTGGGGDDTETLNTDAKSSKSKQTNTTDVNSNNSNRNSNNNNNNNNQSVETEQPIMSGLNLADIKITPVGSLANRDGGNTFKKTKLNKYKNIKIHSVRKKLY